MLTTLTPLCTGPIVTPRSYITRAALTLLTGLLACAASYAQQCDRAAEDPLTQAKCRAIAAEQRAKAAEEKLRLAKAPAPPGVPTAGVSVTKPNSDNDQVASSTHLGYVANRNSEYVITRDGKQTILTAKSELLVGRLKAEIFEYSDLLNIIIDLSHRTLISDAIQAGTPEARANSRLLTIMLFEPKFQANRFGAKSDLISPDALSNFEGLVRVQGVDVAKNVYEKYFFGRDDIKSQVRLMALALEKKSPEIDVAFAAARAAEAKRLKKCQHSKNC